MNDNTDFISALAIAVADHFGMGAIETIGMGSIAAAYADTDDDSTEDLCNSEDDESTE